MIAERNIKQFNTNEIVNYLSDAAFDGYLTELEFHEIIAELDQRKLHPEVFAKFISFGKKEWRSRYEHWFH